MSTTSEDDVDEGGSAISIELPTFRAPLRQPGSKFAKRKDKRVNQFRLRSKIVLFTWSQIDVSKFPWELIKTKLESNGCSKLAIGKEHHQDGGTHYHCLAVHPSTFNTRNVKFMDIAGYHPNIKPIKMTPHKTLDYVRKENCVFCNIDADDLKKNGRQGSKNDEVFANAMEATNRNDMLKYIQAYAPTKFVTQFPAIKSCADSLFSDTEGITIQDPECDILFNEFPGLQDWVDATLPKSTYASSCCGGGTVGIGHSDVSYSEARLTPALTESSTITTTSFTERGSYGQSCEVEGDCGFFPEDFLDERYAIPISDTLKGANTTQGRVKSLILWGPTRMGKSVFARKLGRYCLMAGRLSVKHFKKDCEYMILDDLEEGLPKQYKLLLQGAPLINWTDKYMKGEQIAWGRPCIYLSNDNPLENPPRHVDTKWLQGNCIIIHVDRPLISIADS
ncbi:replication associated protein [Byrsonima crassifolia associated gemycircularvirus]|nr:replication associated protein [Byrsonima crassifolia associated gemycircularvirus]